MTSYTWEFRCIDNGGKHQYFKIKARDKTAAINAGFAKAEKNAAGDITSWDCRLLLMF